MLAVIAPLQFLIDIFEQVLLFFHDSIGLGWGLSIIFMTLAIRTLLLPLTVKQFTSMRALQVLAPEMKKIQEKYKDDRQRMQQEMAKFYQEHKVNPFGSCLPLVAQLPVFISLFYMLRKDLKEDICGPESKIAATAKELGKTIQNTGCDKVDHGSATFWFIHDLTAPATGGVLILLLVLYVLSQLLSSLLTPMAPGQDKNQRYIMLALPFFFVLFVKGFPSGLLVYWITTNFFTVTQFQTMRRVMGPPPVPLDKDGNPLIEQHHQGTSLLGDVWRRFSGREVEDETLAGDVASTRPAKAVSRETPEPKSKPAKARSATGGNGSSADDAPRRPSGPPPSARKKKKRSGRRR